MQFYYEDTVRSNCKTEQKDEELRWLFLEFILLFFRERDDSDKLPFKSRKVGSNDTDRNTKGFSVGLEFAHFLFHVDLDDGGSFENVGAFVEFYILS